MKIKTYIVDNLPDAYPLIFQDLGEAAFILRTKPIRTGGFFGLFGRRQVEVVAAADLSEAAHPINHPNPVSAALVANPINHSIPMPNQASKEPNEAVQQSAHSQLQVSELQPPKTDSQQEVLKELSEMKGLIRAMVQDGAHAQKVPKSLEKWMIRLEEHEVDAEVIQYILKKANMMHGHIDSMKEQEIEATLLAIIEQLFDEGITKEPTTPTSSFVTLVGPTGVGKTTTIAKLAAARVFQQRQRVGLLTTDTFRIGAVEQLKTYANILNVPLGVVGKPDELKTAMAELKGCHYVFMDSAGRNYLEDEYIEEINQYLRYDEPQENYLVLSMTTRWRDMRKIVERMKSVPIDKLILTKWDETSCYGVALNMLYHYPYPLSYICLGQGVPQDIMTADPCFLAKKLLGVDENDSRSSTSIKTTV